MQFLTVARQTQPSFDVQQCCTKCAKPGHLLILLTLLGLECMFILFFSNGKPTLQSSCPHSSFEWIREVKNMSSKICLTHPFLTKRKNVGCCTLSHICNISGILTMVMSQDRGTHRTCARQRNVHGVCFTETIADR